MADQNFLWGPELKEYSQRRFEPYTRSTAGGATYEESVTWLNAYGMLPLNAMESALQESDPRIDEDTLIHDTDLQLDYRTICNYADKHKHKLFERRYGFVAFRRLLHSICLAIVEAEDGIDTLLASLPSHAPWSEMSQLAAFMALDAMAQELQTDHPPEGRSRLLSLPILEMTPDMPNESSMQLLISLWVSRAAFITLCLQGHLPGCAVLLRLIYFRLGPEVSGDVTFERATLFLQDIASRLYLVGSHRDRQILEPLYMLPLEKNIHWPNGATRFASTEDNDIIVNSYSGLLLVWRQNSSSIQHLSVDFMCHLIEFTLHVTISDQSTKLPRALDVLSLGTQTLWLLFEHHARIPLVAHSDVRRLAIYYFGILRISEHKFVKTQADRRQFARMLSDTEILSLIARIMLLVTDKGHEFEDTRGQEHLAERLEELEDTINLSVSTAPKLFVDASIEWAKVLRHLWAWVEMWTDDPEKQSLMDECALQPWGQYGKSLHTLFEITPQGCAYPRCFEQLTQEGTLKVRLLCGGCRAVAYCDSKCQQA